MSLKYIGVVAAAYNNENIKRAALLCDEVVCNNGVGDAQQAVTLGIIRPALPTEAKYAYSMIPEANVSEALLTFEARKADVNQVRAKIQHEIDALSSIIGAKDQLRLTDSSKELLKLSVESLGVAVSEFGDQWTRFHAELMRLSAGDNLYIPILYHARIPESGLVCRARIVRVVFEALPLPDADTPWGAINDWRNDPEATEKYLALRAWIARFARGNPTSVDVAEELVSSLATYQRYMMVQHKKMRRTRLEAIVLPLAEIAEDTLHLRLSKAAAKLFSLFKEEATLLESELSAPGREVAYIAASKARFGTRVV
jgi:hypothetical protein